MDEKLATVKEVTEEMLAQLGIEAEMTVEADEDNEVILVDLQSEDDNALLVGYHGKNLSALQTLVSLMVHHRLDEWVHIVIDVDDYREKREEQLKEMADRAVEQAQNTGQSIAIANLNAAERRHVHMYLGENEAVETHSEGKGRNRQLIISLKE